MNTLFRLNRYVLNRFFFFLPERHGGHVIQTRVCIWTGMPDGIQDAIKKLSKWKVFTFMPVPGSECLN